MKFSVILSNYNGEKYLEEVINSVLAQDYEDYEFIIVDDGSKDGSPEIIRRFAEAFPQRILPLLETENQGQAAGFNKGFKASSGDIITFIDSDDIWMPYKLSRLDNFISITGPAALYQHNLYFLKNGVKTQEVYRPLLLTGAVYEESCKTRRMPSFVPTSGLAFPRDVLEKVMPIPLLFRTCADGYLTRTSFCHGRVASICEAWGYYRVHEGNAVFHNPGHDGVAYCERLLIPSLNYYYENTNRKLNFPALYKFVEAKTPAPSASDGNISDGNSAHLSEINGKILKLVPISESGMKESFRSFFWKLVNASPYDVYQHLWKRFSNSSK